MRARLNVAFVFLTFLSPLTTSAQVATGQPWLGSFAGGPDVINLGNLNVNWTFPLIDKPGRGIPFVLAPTLDSSIWYPVTSNGITSWQPVSSWGWAGLPAGYDGQIKWQTPAPAGPFICGPPVNGNAYYYSYYTQHFTNYVFIARDNTPHPFPTNQDTYYSYGSCYQQQPPGPSGPDISTATDGSGYSLVAYPNGYSTIADKNGVAVRLLAGQNTIQEDANGNYITCTSTSCTDTSGTTEMTVSGGASLPPMTITVPGISSSYTINYTTYSIKTSFNCTNVHEYGPTSVPLVSSIQLPDGRTYAITYEQNGTYYTGRVASVKLITDSSGPTITYAYSGGDASTGIYCADGSTPTLKRTTPDGQWTYSRSSVSPQWKTTVTAPPAVSGGSQDQTEIQFLQGAATVSSNFYEIGRQVFSGSTIGGTVLDTLLTCYASVPTSCRTAYGSAYTDSTGSPTSISYLSGRVVTSQLPSSGGIVSSGSVELYDSGGHVYQHDTYDFGALGSGSFSPTLLQRHVTLYYAISGLVDNSKSVSIGNVYRLQKDYTVDGSGNTISYLQNNFDQTATVSSGAAQRSSGICASGSTCTIGNVTSTYKWISGGNPAVNGISGTNYQTMTYSNYDTGVVDVSTDVNGSQTTYTFGASSCGASFPTQVSSQTGGSVVTSLQTSAAWNCNGGVQATGVDVNGNTTTYGYGATDQFWRPTSTTNGATGLTTSYTYPSASTSTMTVATAFPGASATSTSVTSYDRLGRVTLQQAQQGPSSSSYDTVAVSYDGRGRRGFQTIPYQGTLGQSILTTPGTTTTYDALDRVAQVKDGGTGTATYTYSGNDTLVATGPAPSGENQKQRNLEYNGAGWLTSVCEITSGTTSWPGGSCSQTNARIGYFTKYGYNGAGWLRTVQQNAQGTSIQARGVNYDGLGRKTSETIPEWSAGTGTAGASSYTYDSDSSGSCSGTYTGDLVKQTDNVGNITCFTYDKLHRPLSSKVASGTYALVTPLSYYVYDAATYNSTAMQNAKGALAEAYTCTGSCTSKVTDVFMSTSPVTSGPTSGGVVRQTWESTPHSGGYFLTQDAYFPNGTVGAVATSLVGASNSSTTNQITDSSQVGGNSWFAYCGDSSNMTLNAPLQAPDGSFTATKWVVPSTLTCGSSSSWGALTVLQSGLTAGATYTVSVWLRGAVGGEQVAIGVNDCHETGVTLTTSWVRYSTTFPSISTGCGTGDRGFQVLDNGTPGATYYAWGPQTVRAATAEPYVATTNGPASYIGIPSLAFGVDGEGRPYSATDGTNNLVTSVAYNPTSLPTTVTIGNSATGSGSDQDSFQYDPNTNRPTNLTYAIKPTSNSFNVTSALTWNPNGSLQKLIYTDGNDASKNQTCNYAADDLSRIASVNCGTTTWAQNFTYDPFGNINKANAGNATSYAANYNSTTNQVSSGITPLPTYDANGNQLTSTPANLTWNALNEPISVGGMTATYDALGRMVETGSGSTYNQFVFRPSGDMLAVYNGSLVKGLVPLPGGGTAVYNSGGLNFIRHKDWLGSSRLATTWAHVVYAKEAYAPFGEVYNEAGTADRSFTGQDQDVVTGAPATGVYDFLFRKYDPSAGRWLSPDPAAWAATSPDDPQSLNRYAYVTNRPMTLTDLAGLDCNYESNPDATSPGDDSCLDSAGGGAFGANGDDNVIAHGEYNGPCSNGDPGCMQATSWRMLQGCDPGTNTICGQIYQQFSSAYYNGGPIGSSSSYILGGPSDITPKPKPNLFDCTFDAKTSKALATTTLDGIGGIPGGGNILHGVQFAAAILGGGVAVSGDLRGAGLASTSAGLAIADQTGAKIAVHGVEMIPALGNAVSIIAFGFDILAKDGVIASYKSCLAGTS